MRQVPHAAAQRVVWAYTAVSTSAAAASSFSRRAVSSICTSSTQEICTGARFAAR